MTKANYHTHTTWCDGKDTPEAVVAAAIDKGFSAIGFSSHSMLPEDDTPWLLTPEKAPRYAAEIRPPRRGAREGVGGRRLEPHCHLGVRAQDGKGEDLRVRPQES